MQTTLAATQRVARKSTIAANRRFAGLQAAQRPAIRRMAASAFTLTELLVVITIIAVLASLITAGAMAALAASKRAAITTEIGQLADAVERFKNAEAGGGGGAYPPNAMNVLDTTQRNWSGNLIYDQTINDFIRSFRKAFPRHNEPEGLLRRLAGYKGNLPSGSPSASILDGGMNAAEAVYFWLGGFSSDAVFPISGAGGPSFAETNTPAGLDPGDEILENRIPLYDFDRTRLAPRNDDGVFDGRFVDYGVDLNRDGDVSDAGEERRINLWTYHPKGLESSYVYFDASRHDPEDYDVNLAGDIPSQTVFLFGLKKIREGFSSSATPAVKDIHFVNKNKFQILHAGLDDTWGDWRNPSPMDISMANDIDDASNLLLFPTGPFTGDVADTLTNFTQGTLESAQE